MYVLLMYVLCTPYTEYVYAVLFVALRQKQKQKRKQKQTNEHIWYHKNLSSQNIAEEMSEMSGVSETMPKSEISRKTPTRDITL